MLESFVVSFVLVVMVVEFSVRSGVPLRGDVTVGPVQLVTGCVVVSVVVFTVNTFVVDFDIKNVDDQGCVDRKSDVVDV